MAYKLIGKDFTPPDLRAKVTGKAKYAEDFRAEGMLFCKLLLSPMPHARVTAIDASAALAMDGVVAVLTADDVPTFAPPAEPILTNKPGFVGDPILAIAAVDETTAADALEKIKVSYEPLPFVIDPLQSLYPGGPEVGDEGNVVMRGQPIRRIKWTARDFAAAGEGELPMGEPAAEWTYGDPEAGFAAAALVLDETFVTQSNPHHSMEPRSSFAYWQNGKCYLHGSSQSQSYMIPELAILLDIPPQKLVYIAEFCGGGFGSKGHGYSTMVISAHMAKKTGRPCMLRISRAEEYYLGSARAGFQGRIRLGFRADGRLLAADLYIVQQSGPTSGFWDFRSAGNAVSLVYTPLAMRFRAIPVLTNTPRAGPQRGPGQNQIACAVEPLMDKAARRLGLDRLAIREINAPDSDARYSGDQGGVTSSYMREALAMGAAKFDWAAKQKLSGNARGPKVIGVGVGQAYHSGGSSGFDGLVRITPDGKLHIHSGVGNLGTYSYAATSRVAAEVLGCDWDDCIIERGDSRRHLPWTFGQFGSNTSFTMSRANYVAAMDAKRKLQQIAALELGGDAGDYDVGAGRVFLTADPDKHLTFAAAAARAIELGGEYDGHEAPGDIMFLTREAVAGLAGSGLIGVARDNLRKEGLVPALATGFMMIELDRETGKLKILEYVGAVDCGTVLHPQSLATQIRGGAVMGIGFATLERVVYDPQNGLPANVGLYQAKPPSYLDVPAETATLAVDKPDPQNPVGAKGIGEPVMGCAAAALLCAISDALGGHYFNRTPVVPDMIVNAVAGRPQSHKPLQVNTQ